MTGSTSPMGNKEVLQNLYDNCEVIKVYDSNKSSKVHLANLYYLHKNPQSLGRSNYRNTRLPSASSGVCTRLLGRLVQAMCVVLAQIVQDVRRNRRIACRNQSACDDETRASFGARRQIEFR